MTRITGQLDTTACCEKAVAVVELAGKRDAEVAVRRLADAANVG